MNSSYIRQRPEPSARRNSGLFRRSRALVADLDCSHGKASDVTGTERPERRNDLRSFRALGEANPPRAASWRAGPFARHVIASKGR
jgi:hypothetical protein